MDFLNWVVPQLYRSSTGKYYEFTFLAGAGAGWEGSLIRSQGLPRTSQVFDFPLTHGSCENNEPGPA